MKNNKINQSREIYQLELHSIEVIECVGGMIRFFSYMFIKVNDMAISIPRTKALFTFKTREIIVAIYKNGEQTKEKKRFFLSWKLSMRFRFGSKL